MWHDRLVARLTVNGTNLDFTEAGAGPPIVLIHGSASDRQTWDGVAGHLVKSNRVIAYSRRYHWPNEKIEPGADYSMTEHVNDLVALVDALELENPALVGHSYGGFIALLAAIGDPERLSRLILIEPPVIPLLIDDPPKPSQLLRLFARNPAAAYSVLRFGITAVNPARVAARRQDLEAAVRIQGMAVLGRERFEQLSDERFARILDNYTLAEFTGSGFPPLVTEEVSRVRTPTMLVNGAESPRIFHHLSDRLGGLLPDVIRREIPGASHNIQEDAPTLLAEQISAFTTPGHR
jgi:pimeloyl-ACP methyl ester carboxylesterase